MSNGLNAEVLADREAIRDRLHRYSRGVDRHDVDIITTVWHPDARDTHGSSFDGGPEAFAKWVNAAHERLFVAHNHNIGNTTFSFTAPDQCHTETYYRIVLRRIDGSGMDLLAGRYLDRFERRNGEWRVARRVVVMDWAASITTDETAMPGVPAAGSWDRSDPSYAPLVEHELRDL